MHVCLGQYSSFPGEGGLGLLVACALTEPALLFATTHPSNQAGCQTNRWSQQRDVSSRLLRQMQQMQHWHRRLTRCDTVWQPTVSTQSAPLWLILKEEGGSRGWHCAHDHTQDNVCQQRWQCHFERKTKTDDGGWFHGAGALRAQPSTDCHMWGEACVVRGAGFDLLSAWFNLGVELWPLHSARSKSHYLNAILSMIFSL